MGEVPSGNPTGFAHGFRPLEGDHPPPTPTQRDQLPTSQVFGLSAMSQQTPVELHRGPAEMGVGTGRKRRRLPGPLAFLQQGGSGGLWQQDGGGDSEKDAGKQRLSEDANPDEGEAGGGHFWKGPWLTLCSAIDAPIADECANDTEAVQAFLRGALSPMSEVLAGDFDLRVPIVTAVIDSYAKLSISDVVVDLVDPSGRIKGYLHPGCLEEHGPFLGPGAALLLKDVSIFVSGPGTTRLLNVHPDCVLAVFPADTSLPDPKRLEWLATCDPPFTPRSMPDSDDGCRTQREPIRKTPSPPRSLPPSPTSSVARTGAESLRARPRPRPHVFEGDSRRGSNKQTQQRQQPQLQATPESSSSIKRSVEPSLRQQNRQQQRQRQQHLQEGGRGREQVERQEPLPPQTESASTSGVTQDGDNPMKSLPAGSLHGKRLLHPSSPSSPQSFSQSQLRSQLESRSQSQSQSQSQTQELVSLGQQSDSGDEGDPGTEVLVAAVAAPAAGGSALLSGASSSRSGRYGARDAPIWGTGNPHGPAVSRNSTSTQDTQARKSHGVDDLSSIDSRRAHGSARHAVSVDAAGACDDSIDDERDHGGGRGSDSVLDGGSGRGDTLYDGAALRDPGAATHARHTIQLPQESTAGSRTVRRADLAPGNGKGPSIRQKGAKQRTPDVSGKKAETDDLEVPGACRSEERMAGGTETTDENVRCNTGGGTPSIWDDLDGLGSDDDSNSGDEEVGRGSPSPPLPEGLTLSGGSGKSPSQRLPPQLRRDEDRQGQRQHQLVGADSEHGGDRITGGVGSSVLQATPNSSTTADTSNTAGCGRTESGGDRDVSAATGVVPAAATAIGDGCFTTGSARFSLFGDTAGDDELLDAALDDSE